MKLVNRPGFPQQLIEWITPLKNKEILIFSHIYGALTVSGWPKKAMLPKTGFFIFLSFEDKEKQIEND